MSDTQKPGAEPIPHSGHQDYLGLVAESAELLLRKWRADLLPEQQAYVAGLLLSGRSETVTVRWLDQDIELQILSVAEPPATDAIVLLRLTTSRFAPR